MLMVKMTGPAVVEAWGRSTTPDCSLITTNEWPDILRSMSAEIGLASATRFLVKLSPDKGFHGHRAAFSRALRVSCSVTVA